MMHGHEKSRIAAVDTRGGNRMRESCTYGSVRGVRGNSHPYRAPDFCCGAGVRCWHSSSNRCNAPIRELSEAQRTCRELVARVDPTLLTLSGPEGPEIPPRIEPLI